MPINDLDNKVSKSGDTLSGNLAIEKSGAYLFLKNKDNNTLLHQVSMGIEQVDNKFYIYDTTGNKVILSQGITGNTIFDGVDLKAFASKIGGIIVSGVVSGDGSGNWIKNSLSFTLTKTTLVHINEPFDKSGCYGLGVSLSTATDKVYCSAIVETSFTSSKQLTAVLDPGTYQIWTKNDAADGVKVNPLYVYKILELE